MKRNPVWISICGFLVILFGLSSQSLAGTFFDAFDDGNADGWVFPFYPGQSQGPGIWSVENGTLVQRYTGDGNRALVNNLLLSHQVIETQLSTLGYAGVVLWHQNGHSVAVNLNPAAGGRLVFFEGPPFKRTLPRPLM